MPFQNNLLVFSTSRAIRDFHSLCSKNDSIISKTITINEFFSEILFCAFKITPDEIRFHYLIKSISDDFFEQLGLSQGFSLFAKQSEYLFRFFEELANEKVTLESLNKSDCYAMYEDHINMLAIILKNYKQMLCENNFFDKITIVEHHNFNTDFISQFENIYFYIDGYLSKFEFDCLLEISKFQNLILKFDFTKFNKKNIEKLSSFGEFSQGFSYDFNLSSKTILSSNKIYKNDYFLWISPFAKRIEQINFAKYAVSKMILNGIEASKICLVLPDEEFAQQLMLFDDAKIFNFAMGRKINETNIYQKFSAFYYAFLNDDLLCIEKLKFYHIDRLLVDKYKKQKYDTVSFDVLIDLKSFIDSEIDNDIKQKINFIFFYFEGLLKLGLKITVFEILKNFIEKLNEISIDYVGGGEVTVLGILETRGVQFDGVVVLDFNDSILPKPSIKDKYISTSIKKLSNLTTFIDRKNLQKHYYNTLFSNAKEVYLSYVLNDNDSFSTLGIELLGSQKISSNEHKIDFLKQNILQSNYYKQSIMAEFDPFSFIWSTYKLKDFLNCKRKFYLSHIKKILEPNHDLYKIDKKLIGNIVHQVLKNIFFEGVKFEDSNAFKAQMKKTLNIYKKENQNLIFDLSVMEHHLIKIIDLECQNFSDSKSIISTERKFNFAICNLNFSISIDRIDKVGEETWIIDYKTSSFVDIDEENDFQLEIYAIANLSQKPRAFLYDLKNSKMIEKKDLLQRIDDLKEILSTFKKESIDFEKTEEVAKCKFCNYKIICGRD